MYRFYYEYLNPSTMIDVN